MIVYGSRRHGKAPADLARRQTLGRELQALGLPR